MAQILRELTADVVRRGTTRALFAKQGDVNSRFLNVRIQEDGVNIQVKPDATVIANVQRPDKQLNALYGTVNDDGTVRIPLTSWVLELPGTVLCDISIIKEENVKLTTMQFNIYVEEAVNNDPAIIETEEYSVIVDLLNRTSAASNMAEEAAKNAKIAENCAHEVSQLCVDATTRALETVDLVENSLSKTGKTYTELWCKSSDTSFKTEQIIYLSEEVMETYDDLLIEYADYVSFSPEHFCTIPTYKKGTSFAAPAVTYLEDLMRNDDEMCFIRRKISLVSSVTDGPVDSIKIGTAYLESDAGTSDNSNFSAFLIPVKILGVKQVAASSIVQPEDPMVIDPVFANNSWETIAWVAQHDDPSKYWKVGDYKMIATSVKKDTLVCTNLIEDIYDWCDGNPYVRSEIHYALAYFTDWHDFEEIIGYEPGTYTLSCLDESFSSWVLVNESKGEQVWEGNSYFTLGIELHDVAETPDSWTFVVEQMVEGGEYPLQIIGFNHDKVSNPYEYGKEKAGITLMLGCTRTARTEVSVYKENISSLSISSSDNHIISPNKVGNASGTNWADGTFRTLLAQHLNVYLPKELRQHVVAVDKMSSRYFNAKNFYRDWAITSDKYFLMSEFEMYGEQINTKASEGEQYELFKTDSKVIITPELWNAINKGTGQTAYSRFWLRSVASKYTDPYIPSTDYFNPMSGFTENPDYTNGVNTRTNSVLVSYSDKFNYSPSAAHGTTQPTYIAPCMCL